MIGYILRDEENLLHTIMERTTNGNKDQRRPRKSYIKKMISNVGLTSFKKLYRLAGIRDEWKNYGKLQNQPQA